MKGLASYFARIDNEYEEQGEAQSREDELKDEIFDDIRDSIVSGFDESTEHNIDLTEVWAEIERLIDNKMEELKNG